MRILTEYVPSPLSSTHIYNSSPSTYAEIEYENSRKYINYIRNSVKVIINAYNGDITFYITDRTDPIIMTYRNMYPDLFVEDELPEDIQKHLVYPKFLYNIQADVINQYHDISEDVLYRGEDIWDITSQPTSVSNKKMEPYYTILRIDLLRFV